MKPRHQRITVAAVLVALVAGAVALVLSAFQSNLVFFYSPSQVALHQAPAQRTFRLGGLVVVGSVKREGVRVAFAITDTAQTLPVQFDGILPDLFKEGRGVVAQGQLRDGVFIAKEVLAKHDENYMPPEAAAAVRSAAQHSTGTGSDTTVPREGGL